MKKNIARIMRSGVVSAGLAAMLCVPSLSTAQSQEKSFADMINKFALVPAGEQGSEMLTKAAAAVSALKRMQLPQASKLINEALQLDARNSYLHFLSGFVYHLQARQGDAEKNEMAIEGYRQALHLDQSNWIAKEFLGLAYMDLKKFDQAKEQFSETLLMSPDSTVSIYGLMATSYMTGDPATACAMADRYRQFAREPNMKFIRTSVSVYASCGAFDKAEQMRHELSERSSNTADVERVDRRMAQWKALYQMPAQGDRQNGTNAATGMMPIGFKVDSRDPPPTPPAEVVEPAAASTPAAAVVRPEIVNDGTPRMILVDVVMISTEELITTAKGINLLSALTLQFGSPSAAAYSNSYNSFIGSSTVITKALTIPALTYSMNIANASSGVSEVLARPTLAAIEGQPSEFFSGTSLNAGVVSTSSVRTSVIPVDKRFGVKLAVTPNFLPNGMVKIKVDALRTFLNANTNSSGFAYRLDIAETSTNANVVMQLGDTLVLSGLTDKETSSSRTGVPLLQDVPLIQYLFSNRRTSDYQNSVLILLTPRAPVYTSKVSRDPTSGAMTDSMKVLPEKLGFSGRTPSNVESILGHLKTTSLFTEFRQGDVSLERWDRMNSTGDRLKQALEFLYY